MKNGIILLLCFLPLIVVYIVLKFSLLFSEISKEVSYIKEEEKKPHGPYILYNDEEEETEDDW